MGLAENIRISLRNYWVPEEIRRFAYEVRTYNAKVLENPGRPNQSHFYELASLEKRARELDHRYVKGVIRGSIAVFAGLGLVQLDSLYNLEPGIIDKLATPIGLLIAVAGAIHAYRREVASGIYVLPEISLAERITIVSSDDKASLN